MTTTARLLAFFDLVGAVSPGGAEDSGFVAGARVAARYGDGNWYTGAIAAVKGGSYKINYDDGSSTSVERDMLRLLSKAIRLKPEERVLAQWGGCMMYPGTVKEIRSGEALIAWEDGSEPSAVALELITNEVAESPAPAAPAEVTIHKGGSIIGSIDSDGTVRIEGSIVGSFEPNGEVWREGSLIGEIGQDGEIWKDGSVVGSVESDGTVRRGGSIIGSVEPDGTVWEEGSVVGSAPGATPAQAAGFFFFYFLGE